MYSVSQFSAGISSDKKRFLVPNKLNFANYWTARLRLLAFKKYEIQVRENG